MRAAAALAVSLLAAGCAREPAALPAARLDGDELFRRARLVTETAAVDLGEPAARRAQWEGWGADERTGSTSFVWGAGDRSQLVVDVVEPRPIELRLRGWSYPFPDEDRQQVRVAVNGVEVGRRWLGRVPTTLSFEVDEEHWRSGENFVDLRYERHHAGAGESPWAAAWDWFALGAGRARDGGAPRIDVERGVVTLPARTALEWAIELPGDSWLAWDEAVAAGGSRWRVEVWDERGGRRSSQRGGGGGRLRLNGARDPHRLTGIHVRAAGGEVTLQGLRIHHPPPAATEPRPVATPAAAKARPNLLVYLVDTLRADRLGCYGYDRPTSPAIDRLAAEGVRWIDGRAQTSWTRPAVATILTGLHPPALGVEDTHDRLADRFPTVAELLEAAGWQTAMFTTNGNVSARLGFSRGWGRYEYLAERRRRPEHHVQSDELNDHLFEWLARRDRERPFLLFAHSSDPHDPYTPRSPFAEALAAGVPPGSGARERMRELTELPAAEAESARAGISALYDAEIAANDDAFGRLLERLEREGLADSTAVLLLSDHGEEFHEHGGWTHGQTLYEEQLRVPFVLRLPGRRAAGTVLPGPAEQIDVAPTLLALAGLAPPASWPGRNLLRDLEGDGREAVGRASFAWLSRNALVNRAVTRAQWKLIHHEQRAGLRTTPLFELFALGTDPGEHANLARSRPLRRRWLEGQLAAALFAYRSELGAERAELDPELEADLRALGYL